MDGYQHLGLRIPTKSPESGSLTSKIKNLQFPPSSASWVEEMENRPDRHIRNLVVHIWTH